MQPDPLSADEALAFVADPGAGGTCVFLGTVRDHSKRMEEIAGEARDRWDLCAVSLLHRTGALQVGETSVIVAASAPHRADAFEAARHAIERLKEAVPIWKKEGLVTGESHWIMGS